MNIRMLGSAVCVLGLLGACAQQEEPVQVRPEPVFDKYGGGSCEEGYIYVPGTALRPPQCVPEDECEPVYNSAGTIIDCPPPRTPRPSGGGDDNGSRPPGAATAGRP